MYTRLVNGEDLSPEQYGVFESYYHFDMRKLEKSYKKKRKNMYGAWSDMLAAADDLGIKRTHGKDSADYPMYLDFFNKLCELEKYCDLRAMLHEWLNTDLDRVKHGVATISQKSESELLSQPGFKKLEILSVPVIMARYQELLQDRGKRS